jgi:hypothetical protein
LDFENSSWFTRKSSWKSTGQKYQFNSLRTEFPQHICSAFRSACLNSQRLSQFVAPKENQVAKPFLTSKQDKKSHGVPDDPEFDAGNFEFAPGCLQPIQPTTLFLN